MGDLGSVPGLGRSPGERKGYPLHYSGLENSLNYSPWGSKELDTTERLSLSLSKNPNDSIRNSEKGKNLDTGTFVSKMKQNKQMAS